MATLGITQNDKIKEEKKIEREKIARQTERRILDNDLLGEA